MSLRLVTPASALAVSLSEAKLHLRVDGTDEDTLITALITAATETAEQITGRAIMPQTWEVTLDEFPDESFELTRVPVASITSITYIDTDSNTMTLNPAYYQLQAYDDYSFVKVSPAYGIDWPRPSDSPIDTWAEYFINPTVPREGPCLVKLRFVAGYANAAAVPEGIKSWIKLQLASMYENREADSSNRVVRMSFVDGLLDRYKVWA